MLTGQVGVMEGSVVKLLGGVTIKYFPVVVLIRPVVVVVLVHLLLVVLDLLPLHQMTLVAAQCLVMIQHVVAQEVVVSALILGLTAPM